METIECNYDLISMLAKNIDTVMTPLVEETGSSPVYFKGGWELELRNELCRGFFDKKIWCYTEQGIYTNPRQQVDLLVNNYEAPHQYPIELKVQNMPSENESNGAYITRHAKYWAEDIEKMKTTTRTYPLKLSMFVLTDRNFEDEILAHSLIKPFKPEILAGWNWWRAYIVKC